MSVYRVNKTRDFTVMGNTHLRDKNLSLKAVGLLSKMLSFNDGWQFSTRGLAAICKEGPDAILSALKELEKNGYLVRHRGRDSKGRLVTTEFDIYESPQAGLPHREKPHRENPDVDSPDVENPHRDNPAQINTIQVINQERNTLSMNYQSINLDGMDRMDERSEYEEIIKENLDNASRFLVDKANPGLTALFVDAFRQQTEPQKEATSEKTEEKDPEVVAWENDEITSIEVKTVEIKSPVASMPEEAAQAPKAHRLTAEEKEIKAAIMDTLKGQIAYNNDGMRASYRASNHSFNLLARNGVRIDGNTVTQNGEPLFKIHRRHAARKTQGCYRELMPTLEYVKQEQKQEKPSIRDQLKAAAKTKPEKKSPVKSKTHDMEL